MILETSQIPEPIYYCLRRPTPSRRPPRARPGQRPCPTDPFSPSKMAMNVQCPSPKEAGERAAFSSAPPALVSTAPAWGAPLVFCCQPSFVSIVRVPRGVESNAL